MYLNIETFLPKTTQNALRSNHGWNIRDDDEWFHKIANLEMIALSVIKATINFEEIKDEKDLLLELINKHVQSQLCLPIVSNDTFLDNGELALQQFNKLLNSVKKAQNERGVTSNDKADERSGILMFN